tara:strand:+ start:33 stop:716 length:684 start_codon:yes stop_codon:yes gene_type:complete
MKSSNKYTLKVFVAFCLFFMISGCTAFDTSRIAPGYKDTYIAIKNALVGYPESPIPVKTINNIPYASMLIKIGKGPTGLVILESKLGKKYTWLSADEIYLVLQNGKIIESRGFENNLTGSFQAPLPFEEIIKGEIHELQDYYSYDDPPLKNLGLAFKYQVKGKEYIQILDKKKELLKVEEYGSSKILGWQFVNTYWIDGDYQVWKSIQYISPKLPEINYILTKKPSM